MLVNLKKDFIFLKNICKLNLSYYITNCSLCFGLNWSSKKMVFWEKFSSKSFNCCFPESWNNLFAIIQVIEVFFEILNKIKELLFGSSLLPYRMLLHEAWSLSSLSLKAETSLWNGCLTIINVVDFGFIWKLTNGPLFTMGWAIRVRTSLGFVLLKTLTAFPLKIDTMSIHLMMVHITNVSPTTVCLLCQFA